MEVASCAAVFAAAVVLLTCLVLVLRKRTGKPAAECGMRESRTPVGPSSVPLLGRLEALVYGVNAQKAFAWSCTCGPVIRVKAGFTETVILNDLESIKAFLSHKNMLYRSPSWILNGTVDLGFAVRGAKAWEENRRHSLDILRMVGFGKPDMEKIIAEECQNLRNCIARKGEQAVELSESILASVNTIMCRLLFGCRCPVEDPCHQDVRRAIRDEFSSSRSGSLVSPFPLTFHAMVKRLAFTKAGKLLDTMMTIRAFTIAVYRLVRWFRMSASKQNKPQITNADVSSSVSLLTDNTSSLLWKIRAMRIEVFQRCMCYKTRILWTATTSLTAGNCLAQYYEYVKAKPPSMQGKIEEVIDSGSASDLIGNATALLLAGTLTVSAFLTRLLLRLANNVDTMQARIQREIDAVIGCERQPRWEDRYSTPYTMAVIWESHRLHSVLPLGLPRFAGDDAVIGRYFVGKGSTVIANIWAVHNNPDEWTEPEKFDPGRFLNEDGSLDLEVVKKVVPFSVGKRMCPGEALAPVEIYLFLMSMLQKFCVRPQPGCEFDTSVRDSVIMQTGRHFFRCIPRTQRCSLPEHVTTVPT